MKSASNALAQQWAWWAVYRNRNNNPSLHPIGDNHLYAECPLCAEQATKIIFPKGVS